MLGDGQWLALQSWLLTVKDRYPVKFIVSSVRDALRHVDRSG